MYETLLNEGVTDVTLSKLVPLSIMKTGIHIFISASQLPAANNNEGD